MNYNQPSSEKQKSPKINKKILAILVGLGLMGGGTAIHKDTEKVKATDPVDLQAQPHEPGGIETNPKPGELIEEPIIKTDNGSNKQ